MRAVEMGSGHLLAARRGKRVVTMSELEDADSEDILTEVSRGIDKWLWFVEAHQQARS